MAEINDPQLARFCNEKIRPLANALWESYFRSDALVEDYDVVGIDTILGKAADEDLVADGSESDGRTRISAQDVRNMHKLLDEFKNFLDGEVQPGISRLQAIAKSHTNTL